MRKIFCFILVLAMALGFLPAKADAASTYTLSGTITFSSPLKQNTTLYVYPGYGYGSFWYADEVEIVAKKGATSAAFSLSLAPDVYTLELDGPQEWFYYGVEDKLTDDYSDRMYFDLTEKSITGLKINGDRLLAGSSAEDNVTVTISLPERLAENKDFLVIAGNEEESWTASNWTTAVAGSNKITASFSLDPAEKHFFYFADANQAYTSCDDRTGYLYGSDDGVTSIRSNAKSYDISKGSVVINYTDTYTISGKLDRSGYADGVHAAAYVIAEFQDGEKYADRVVFSETVKTNNFVIYIPRSQRGKTYTLYTAPADSTNNIGIDASVKKNVSSGTLSRNTSVGTVTMNSSFVKYSGTISLPAGVSAPAGGTEISLWSSGEDYYYDFGTYTIPSGSSSTSFAFYAKSGISDLTAILTSPVKGAFHETRAFFSNRSGIAVDFPAEAIISGTVYLPDDANMAFSAELRASSTDSDYYYSYLSIRRGEKSTKYYLHVPKGKTLNFIELYSNYDSSGQFEGSCAYIGSGWKQTSDWPEGSISVTGDKSGVDIYLKEPIHGKVMRPAGMSDFYVSVYVKTAVGDYPSGGHSVWVADGNDFGTYSISIPASDTSSTYKLYYEVNGYGFKYGTWYLKSDGTFTQNEAEAASFPVAQKEKNFTPLAVDPYVKGKIYVPDAVAKDSTLSFNLYSAVKSGEYPYCYPGASYYFNLSDVELQKDAKGRYFEYSVRDEEVSGSGDFYLNYYLADNEALDCSGNLYVLADGSVAPSSEPVYCFNYDGVNPTIVDFTLLPWDDGTKYVFESGHGLMNETVTYTYTYPGECEKLTITFSNRSNEKVVINGKEEYTNAPVTINGKSAQITVTFGEYNDDRYGFACTKIEPVGVTKKKAGVSAVTTPSGGDNVFETLKDDKEVSATVCTDGIAAGTKMSGHAALYDKDGRFLGISEAENAVADAAGNTSMDLSFDTVSTKAKKVTVFVINDKFQPLGECMSVEK